MKHSHQKNSKFLLELDANSQQNPLMAYLVDNHGQLLEKQTIGPKGDFEFKESDHGHHSTRLFIAPEIPDNPKPNLEQLLALNAYEPLLPKRNLKDGFRRLLPIPELFWPQWHWCFCRVRGRVVREFCLSWPFNFCIQLPVCPARVHVCRVKRRIIWELSPEVLLNIRDRLLAVPKLKIPIPIPDPRPFGPSVLPHLAHALPAAAATRHLGEPVAWSDANSKDFNASAAVSQALSLKLQTADTDLLRRALDEHFYEIRPFIPYYDICSWLYRCNELMTIEVDHDGRFDRTFFHPCNEDNDLYFWVEYLVAGSWVTVYRPSLCSGTHWNFVCGSEVTIKVTDSRVTGCRPLTGRYMEVNRIGTHAWLPLVDNSTGLVSNLSFNDGTSDATGAAIPAGNHERPFAGTLPILGGFGSNLPDTAQATHFRVSLKRTSDLDIPANWTVLQTPLYRGYRDEIEVDGLTKPYDKQFLLNEPGQPEFYKIPKNEAMDQTEIGTPAAPATLIDREWASTEFALALIDTNSLDVANTYDIRIELCRTVGGSLQPVSVRRELFQIPDPANFSENIVADDAHIYPASNATDAMGLRIRVRIDRRMTTCSIEDAQVDGVAADPQCGLLNYEADSRAQLGFRVAHPDHRATFAFGVVRGNGQAVYSSSPAVHTNTSGLVNAATADGGYNRSGDQFSNNLFSVTDMLTVSSGGGGAINQCAGAAFAETLYVKAMATDGSVRMSQFDSSAVAAFAIIEDCNCDD
jgi:hypothetical protein